MEKASQRKLVISFIIVGVCLLALLWSCAPKTSDEANANNQANGQTTSNSSVAWTPDMDCSTCHDEAKEKADNTVSSYHIGNQNLTCLSCHADSDELEKAHADMSAKVPTKLKKTKVEESVCLSCHNLSDLAKTTVNSKVLTDQNGKVVNPHDLPQVTEHTATCIDCHSGHEEKPVSETAPAYCTGCHHENVYECGTCHD